MNKIWVIKKLLHKNLFKGFKFLSTFFLQSGILNNASKTILKKAQHETLRPTTCVLDAGYPVFIRKSIEI